MQIARDVFLEILKDAYSAYYTLRTDVACEFPLAFRADYAARDERYWLTKSVKMWGNEKNEFCYVFAAESFDRALAEKCVDWAIADMRPRVRPHGEHQCTNVKVLFVADSLDREVQAFLKKKRFTKSYRFGLHGYTNLLAGAVDLTTQQTVTNPEGHELAPFIKKLFAARA